MKGGYQNQRIKPALAGIAQWIECGLRTKGSLVQFPVRAHAWVVGQIHRRGCMRGNHILMFLSLSFFHINAWLALMRRLLGTWHTTQACALTGNLTSDPLVRKSALSLLSHTSQGVGKFSLIIFQISFQFLALPLLLLAPL